MMKLERCKGQVITTELFSSNVLVTEPISKSGMKELPFENALEHSVWAIDINIPLSPMNGTLSTALYKCSNSN